MEKNYNRQLTSKSNKSKKSSKSSKSKKAKEADEESKKKADAPEKAGTTNLGALLKAKLDDKK